jgi:hypothetical protein
MLRVILWGCFLICFGSHQESEWRADDDTFDPSLHSVVIGKNSWIGDPSPFVLAGVNRTGYTYAQKTNYAGMPASVQLSLMIPLEGDETQPPGGGMLMTDAEQTKTFLELIRKGIDCKPADAFEAVEIKTAMADTKWALRLNQEDGKHLIELVDSQGDKEKVYQFSVNASKKLVGAIEHSLKKLLEEK